MKQSLAGFKPNLISVEVLGFGNDEAECVTGDVAADSACRKKKKGGSTSPITFMM